MHRAAATFSVTAIGFIVPTSRALLLWIRCDRAEFQALTAIFTAAATRSTVTIPMAA